MSVGGKETGEKLAVQGTNQSNEVTSVCEATLPPTGILELYSLLPVQRAGDQEPVREIPTSLKKNREAGR